MPYVPLNNTLWGLITGTTSATANTTTTHAHNGGVAPKFYLLLSRGNGLIYEAAIPDATNISVRSPGVSIPFTAILFY